MKLIYVVLLSALLVVSCGKKNQGTDGGNTLINGAGATFPYPIYSKWFYEYNKINPKATINYQSIGSGGGVRQITEGTVDFGASDSPMSDAEMKKANESNGNNNIMNIPTVIGSVVLTYNIPEVKQNINLTQKAIVEIFSGKIKKWNDPEIANANPGVTLPDKEIIVCYRTDGSGTTYVFTDFLSKASEEWKAQHGTAKDVRFPVGQGGKGNEGVTGLVKQLAYSIGYVEYVYATQNNLNYANVQNPGGEFVTPTIESLTKAAEVSVAQMPDDLRQSITNANGAGAYPISSYTYLLIFQNQKDQTKGKILKDFLTWAATDGQKMANGLGYAPLPGIVVQKTQAKVSSINFNGQTL
jgi:phosphate transport system substrate-binding protein